MKPGDLHPAGWGVVPVALLRDPNLTPTDAIVYAAIVSSNMTYPDGVGLPTSRARLSRIVERSGRNEKTVRRSIKTLETKTDYQPTGYIAIERRDGRTNIYTILPTKPMDEINALEVAEDVVHSGGRPPKNPYHPLPPLT